MRFERDETSSRTLQHIADETDVTRAPGFARCWLKRTGETPSAGPELSRRILSQQEALWRCRRTLCPVAAHRADAFLFRAVAACKAAQRGAYDPAILWAGYCPLPCRVARGRFAAWQLVEGTPFIYRRAVAAQHGAYVRLSWHIYGGAFLCVRQTSSCRPEVFLCP